MVKSHNKKKQLIAAFQIEIEIARAWTWGAKVSPGAPQAPGGNSQDPGGIFSCPNMTDFEVHSSISSIAF
jgi:hypothetical protein